MATLTIESLLIYIAGVLGLSKRLRNGAVEKVIDGANLFDRAGNLLKGDFLRALFPRAIAPLINPAILQATFTSAFANISGYFQNVASTLNAHVANIARRIEPDDNLRAWRIFGYLFQLMFLIAFVYADLIQMVNNFAIILPQDVTEITWLQNLTISLLMTSVGTAIAASFIIAEFGEITHFGRWHELKQPLKTIAQILVWLALILTLTIDVIVALARVTTIPSIAPLLSQETTTQLLLAAGFAQSFVIVPLLIITFLFLGGIVGIAIVYMIVVWFISLVFQVFHLVFALLIWLLIFGVSYIVELTFRTVLWIVTAFLFVLGWVFAGTGATLVKILEVLQKILDIIYFPLDALVEWITSKINRKQVAQAKAKNG